MEQVITPFVWVERKESVSVCLLVGEYKNELFKSREKEGFTGTGYDWEALARVYLEEQKPQLDGIINFDSEGSMYCAYSSNSEALKEFSIGFKQACKNETLIMDLFSRAELD